MRSMTGFGIGDAPLLASQPPASGDVSAGGRLTVEIRAVNHRYLDLRVRAPSQLPELGAATETLARERLTRGRFDVSVRVDGTAFGAVVIDRDLARSVFGSLVALRDELAPNSDVPLALLGAVPNLFVPSITQHSDQVRTALVNAFDAALEGLDLMRLREGLALGDDLVRRLNAVRTLSLAIAARAPLVVELYRKRLTERAARLRAGLDLEVDPGRLEHEITLFADRVDVAEELTRLDSHTAHFETLIASPEAVGRRLDFLLQEMAREANTIGSKGQDAEIAHAVVELKAEIERMREQVQNIE
jgi:uncharacterized protein (TIGR00255 family)